VVAEETARLSGGFGLAVTLHNEVFIGALVALSRSAAQTKLRDAAIQGEAIGCFAVTEPSGGSDLASVQTAAERVGDCWKLTGEKSFISNGGVATHALVL